MEVQQYLIQQNLYYSYPPRPDPVIIEKICLN